MIDGVATTARMSEELFEAIADKFRRVHGMMAPGKDSAAAVGNDPFGYVERHIRFAAFVSLLGPTDRVGILALKQLREMRE